MKKSSYFIIYSFIFFVILLNPFSLHAMDEDPMDVKEDLVRLGQNGPMVSRMGLGCISMSGEYDPDHDDAESIRTIQAAYEMGVNFFDTADVYGEEGHNELLLGQALGEQLKNHREHIVIASKCGFVFSPEAGWHIDLSPEHIERSCQASLERLGVTYIDLYYLHRLPAGGIEGLKASIDALIDLLKVKKINYIGLSEADIDSIRFAHEYLKTQGFPDAFVAVQNEFSLFVQGPLRDGTLDFCQENGISFFPYSPLCRGLLTEKLHSGMIFDERDFRQYLPKFQGENFKHNLRIRDKLIDFSRTKGCTLPQLSLGWLLAQGSCVIPIPGTRYIKNLENNLNALDITLSTEDLMAIDQIVSSMGARGTRYEKEMYAVQNISVDW